MREGLTRPLWLAVVVLAFCVPLFVGLSLTDLENDEAIYSYAVQSILTTGDWLNPRLSPHEDWTFLEKPPLKFWIVAAPMAVGLTPTTEAGMRVWDALFGSIAFLYVFAFGRRLAGPVCGFVALVVLSVYGSLLFNHGIRNNNMEAPLVLCYCGAIHHFLLWSTSASPTRRRWHIAAVWGFFFLGFMTKFVAAFFLPIVLLAAAILDGKTRRAVFEDFRWWFLGGIGFFVLAAPWFLYEMNKEGMGVWRVMVGEHVYQRFTSSLDTSHLQPWNFYFTTVFGELGRAGTLWLVIAGGVLLIVQTVRERRLEQWLVILWFVVPMSLMSIGTSKIHHYAYPFLPPLALAAGYGPAWLLSAGRKYVDWIMNAVQSRIAFFESRGPWFRYVLTGLAVVAVVLSVVTFALGSVNVKIGALQILRNSHVIRPLVVAVILATLAGRGVVAARLLWPLAILLAIMPMDNYESMWRRTRLELHPLRSTRDCLLGIRSAELAAGRPAPGVYAIGEHRWFLHPHFYYLHPVGGWERAETFDPKAAERALFEPGQQRPVILDEETYRLIKASHPEMLFPRRTFGRVVLLTPGPYAACGTQTDPLPGQ